MKASWGRRVCSGSEFQVGEAKRAADCIAFTFQKQSEGHAGTLALSSFYSVCPSPQDDVYMDWDFSSPTHPA